MRFLFISYDNGSFITWPNFGLMHIASVVGQEGHYVENYPQDQFHYPESHLVKYLENNHFDYIGISFCGGYIQYNKMKSIMEAINSLKDRPTVLAGGHMFAPEPEYFLRKFNIDAIFIGEGINTIKDYLNGEITNGVAWIGVDNNYYQTPSVKLIKDVDTIPFPAWHLYPMDYYALMRQPHIEDHERCFSVLSSYGCVAQCNFCFRLDKGIRLRSSESVVEEIKYLKKKYGINYIFFSDELLIASKKRGLELSNAFLEADLNIKYWCNGRLDRVDTELLTSMKKSGCVFINYGIESYDDEILKVMNKKLTVKQVDFGVAKTLEVGISPGLNIIYGQPGESFDVLHKGKEFLLKHDDQGQMRNIRPVCSYPGTELYNKAIKDGLLDGIEDFYENKHKNSDLISVNFTDYTDEEVHAELFGVNCELLRNYHVKMLDKQCDQISNLYFEGANFRGFRNT